MVTNARPLLALAALALIAGVVGYGVGVAAGGGPRMSEIKVFRDVVAYSGDDQVSVTVEDITYGVSKDVLWLDASGSWNGGGWPSCIPARSQTRITFGGAVVLGPTGAGSYRILWIDCRR